MNSDILKLRKEYQGKADQRAGILINGGVKDYAEYTKLVGQITGLNLAITEINDLLEKQRKQNNDQGEAF